MAYTHFAEPVGKTAPKTTRDWLDWMRAADVLHDFLPTPINACNFCGQPVWKGSDRCSDCRQISEFLDVLIAGTYSLHAGLESMVGTFKDGPPSGHWQSLPLGSLLWAIFRKHNSCIEDVVGDDPICTWVPSNNRARGFDQLDKILNSVEGLKEARPWDNTVIRRNFSESRPARKSVSPKSYEVTADVSGRSVILLDDVWTTGASLGSAAAALKLAGADRVIGIVLGRQLHAGNTFEDAPAIYADVASRGWRLDDCHVCARP